MLGKEMRTSNENINYSINLRFIAKKKTEAKSAQVFKCHSILKMRIQPNIEIANELKCEKTRTKAMHFEEVEKNPRSHS